MNDWRLDNVKRLHGVRLRRKRYEKWSDAWDHDHCTACWATFAEFNGPGIQNEGFATCNEYVRGEDYDWVCLSCFADLKGPMQWVEVSEGTP